jgi:hypothetical protein
MNQRAAELARWMIVRARVLQIEHDALRGAAVGVCPWPAAAPTAGKLTFVAITDHGPGNLYPGYKLKPAKRRPRPLLLLSPNRRRVLALIRNRT